MEEKPLKEGKYIYCIVRTEEEKNFGPLGLGGRYDPVYTVNNKGIAAVVSNVLIKEYPVSRENTLCHEKVIEEAMKGWTVLPVRFGTIAENEETVKKILDKERARFVELLDKMQGKKELGVKAVFKEAVIYDRIVTNYEDIKKMKERIASLPPERARNQYIEIGRRVETALERERADYNKRIMDVLTPLAVEVKINDTYGERMVVNAAFLVEVSREKEFDGRVEELDKQYGYLMTLKYVGTVPPFNFVNLVIDTGRM